MDIHKTTLPIFKQMVNMCVFDLDTLLGDVFILQTPLLQGRNPVGNIEREKNANCARLTEGSLLQLPDLEVPYDELRLK